MRYEIVEYQGEWSVQSGGRELARFGDQDRALNDVAERLRDADASVPSSVCLRYQARAA